MIELALPWPPSVNTYWRHVLVRGRVRVLISKAGRQYRENALLAIREQGAPRMPSGARVAVVITAAPPDRRARDLDNILKGVLDSLTHGGVIADDGLIDHLTVTRSPAQAGGVVRVQLQEAP